MGSDGVDDLNITSLRGEQGEGGDLLQVHSKRFGVNHIPPNPANKRGLSLSTDSGETLSFELNGADPRASVLLVRDGTVLLVYQRKALHEHDDEVDWRTRLGIVSSKNRAFLLLSVALIGVAAGLVGTACLRSRWKDQNGEESLMKACPSATLPFAVVVDGQPACGRQCPCDTDEFRWNDKYAVWMPTTVDPDDWARK